MLPSPDQEVTPVAVAYDEAVKDTILEPKAYIALELTKGQVLRIEDLEGTQCSDVVAFNLHDFDEKYSPQNTVNINKHIYLGEGKVLYSTKSQPMLTIVADPVGHHDCICGSCSPEMNYIRYGEKAVGKRTCRENLADAVEPYGIPAVAVPYSFNTWMDFEVSKEGEIKYGETLSKPGDYIDLRAEMDLLVAISNCPQELNSANGWNPTKLRVAVFDAEAYPVEAG